MDSSEETLARRHLEKQMIQDGTAIWKSKKEVEARLALQDRTQLREMLDDYDPWGKPGNGAPMPGALRKTKWITEPPHQQRDAPSSVMTLGRPGHGAPLRTKSGKAKTLIKADPSIRFQFHESARRSVDNDLRYRSSPSDKQNYKRQLDALVYEKKRAKSEENAPPRAARPAQKGDRKKGWTNEVMLRRLDEGNEQEEMYEISGGGVGGGVELVPLLAKHRMVNRFALSSTDVTRTSKIPNGPPKTSISEHEYYLQLCDQVHQRQRMIQDARKEDLESSEKHFQTWQGFWGRPGHGAPKGLSQREKLEVILYHIPVRQVSSDTIH